MSFLSAERKPSLPFAILARKTRSILPAIEQHGNVGFSGGGVFFYKIRGGIRREVQNFQREFKVADRR